jgi:hypothetical protein
VSTILTDAYKRTKPTWTNVYNGLTVPGGLPVYPGPRFAGDPGVGNMYYGTSVEPGRQTIRDFEVQIDPGGDYVAGIYRTYYPTSNLVPQMAAACADALAHHRMPVVSIHPPVTGGGRGADWASVASGAQDAWLVEMATALAPLPGPVWLSVAPEPRGDGPAANWTAMYARVTSVMRPLAPNVAHVPIMNGFAFQTGGDPDPSIWYVPSADIQGVDSYNEWWTYDPGSHPTWDPGKTKSYQPFGTVQRVFGNIIDGIQRFGEGNHAILFAEYGVHYGWRNDAGIPDNTSAAQFILDAFDFCLARGVVGMSYFNSGLNAPWGGWYLDAYHQIPPYYPEPRVYQPNPTRLNAFRANTLKVGVVTL